MKKDSNYSSLKLLGKKSYIADNPEEAIIEKVPNPKKEIKYNIRFSCPEFTSLCPVTSQPDFAYLVIDYVPNELIVESKSLKMFLASFRNHGAFNEDCTTSIALRLVKELNPVWLRITGYWNPRGGVSIDVFFQTSAPPEGILIPEHNISSFSRR